MVMKISTLFIVNMATQYHNHIRMIPTRNNPPQNRDTTGQFLPGHSGNPGGRPVGFRIYAHELKEDFEQVRVAMAKFA